MKIRTIKLLKYASYTAAGMGTLATGYVIYSQGDRVKSGLQSPSLYSGDTRLAILWGVCALVAFYAPVLARHLQSLQDRFRLNDRDFVELYKESLANAINDLIDVRQNPANYNAVELGLLRTIVNITKYYLGAGEETKINANLMIPVVIEDPTCGDIRFLEPGGGDAIGQCRWLLKIDKWAHFEAEVPPDFCLPVYDPDRAWRNRILLGAPSAFIEGKPIIIENTMSLRKHWKSGVSQSVKTALQDYFKSEKKVLRSFASLPAMVDSNALPTAIVNIHWNRKKIFGRSSGLVLDLLLPFLLVTAHVRRAGAP